MHYNYLIFYIKIKFSIKNTYLFPQTSPKSPFSPIEICKESIAENFSADFFAFFETFDERRINMAKKTNGGTPPQLIQEALKACIKVDELEAVNATLEEIEGAEQQVKHISQLISQFYQMQAGILQAANDNNNDDEGGDDDSVA